MSFLKNKNVFRYEDVTLNGNTIRFTPLKVKDALLLESIEDKNKRVDATIDIILEYIKKVDPSATKEEIMELEQADFKLLIDAFNKVNNVN